MARFNFSYLAVFLLLAVLSTAAPIEKAGERERSLIPGLGASTSTDTPDQAATPSNTIASPSDYASLQSSNPAASSSAAAAPVAKPASNSMLSGIPVLGGLLGGGLGGLPGGL